MTLPVPALRYAVALVLLAMAACDDIGNPVVEEDAPGMVETAVDERCEDVAQEVRAAVQEGLRTDAQLAGAHAVSSEEEDITFIAAELTGEGQPDEPPVGLWAVRGGPADQDDEILAVNAIAREHSTWPVDADITEEVDGGEEAHACVTGAAQ